MRVDIRAIKCQFDDLDAGKLFAYSVHADMVGYRDRQRDIAHIGVNGIKTGFDKAPSIVARSKQRPSSGMPVPIHQRDGAFVVGQDAGQEGKRDRRESAQNIAAGRERPLLSIREPEADEVDGSRLRHLRAKMGCCQANPSKGAIRHGDYHDRPRFGQECFSGSWH